MDFSGISTIYLILIFAVCAFVIWFAGVRLAGEIDEIDKHFGLGEALGGLILLSIVTNLPEIAITVSAAWQGHVEIAVGNILGGIAIQTVVLVLLDFFGAGKKNALTSLVKSPVILIEAAAVICLLTLVVAAHVFPARIAVAGISPFAVLIAAGWLVNLYLVKITDAKNEKDDSKSESSDHQKRNDDDQSENTSDKKKSFGATLFYAAIFALLTLAAGFFIEISSDALAKKIGLDGVIFSATILAAATSLPELSTGLASMKLKNYELAVSDIFGGNAFLPTLFLLAELITHQVVFDRAKDSDIYLVTLGIVLTVAYQIGFIVQSRRQIARFGVDSLIVLLIYILGIAGLFFIK